MADKNFKSFFDASLREVNGLLDDFDDCDFYQKRSSIIYGLQPLRLWRDSLRCAARKVWPLMTTEEKKKFSTRWKASLKLGKVYVKKKSPEGSYYQIDNKVYVLYRNSLADLTKLLRHYAFAHGMLLRDKKSGKGMDVPDEWG
jgi:hypothetical protein